MGRRSFPRVVSVTGLELLSTLFLLTCSVQTGAAVNFSISPPSVPNDFTGVVQLKILELSAGATVRVEKYLDENGNGQIDPEEPLLESFMIKDGLAPVIAGITNSDLYADTDGAINGQIIVRVDFSQTIAIDRISGSYIFKVTDPSGSFSPLIQPFALTTTALPQGVTGVVTDATGEPVPTAEIALLNIDTVQFVTSAFDNADGRFTVYSPPGKYLLLPLRRGYIFSIQASTFDLASATLEIKPGQFLTNNLQLTRGNTLVSGVLKDAASGAGIPGIPVYAVSAEQDTNGTFTSLSFSFGLADLNGQFSVFGHPGTWGFTPLIQQLSRVGYLGVENIAVLAVTSTNNTNITIGLPKATSLFYGQLKNQVGKPLAGVQMDARDPNLGFETLSRTDANGNYTLGVIGGNWTVEPESSSLGTFGYDSGIAPETPMEDGQAIEQTFSVSPVRLSISGGTLSREGSFQFQVLGETGRTYEIQASTDLKAWDSQETFTISVSPYDYSDDRAKGAPVRFYRVQQQP